MRWIVPLMLFVCACETDSEIPFNTDLAEGHALEEHTEVAPGVWLLSSEVASGDINYTDLSAPENRTGSPASADRARSCYKYDYAWYNEQTRAGEMFGGRTYWYGMAMAEDYNDNDGMGPDQSFTRVTGYAYTYADKAVDQVYAMTYLYLNGRYVGYAWDQARNARYAYRYGAWDARCKDGRLSLEARTYHSWMNGRSADEYQYIGNTLDVEIDCCGEL